ncbi:hypothetical protein [Adlercreutzia sp. ZJ242]|uniref:hypothetical protein n=1 Tax=Adlercreutzia sp. ZJ242 TaxID=2709409 RepID=UPI0013ECC1F9|nr:hypothetical protein [Adlercreutzia sp. ZJ242]
MLSTSFEFRTKIAQNSKTMFKATLRLANGNTRYLVGDDIMMGSVSFDDAVSSDESFDIGAAIINKFGVTLNNYDRRFDEYDFEGATISPYVGVQLDSGGVEWLGKGVYGVDKPEAYGSTIGLVALDNMRKFEHPYSDVATSYPATLGTIVADICRKCGVTLKASNFVNSTYVVRERPEDDALTCLQMIAHAAQASGNFARCNASGHLVLDWYNTAAFEMEDWIDGEEFDNAKPYASGDTADGGNFDSYGSGDAVEGGEFGANVYASLFALASETICTDDVVVTGVSVTAQDERDDDGTAGEEGETALYGSQGYVLSIEENPLILFGEASTVARQVGIRVVGMRFRPFGVSAIGNPAVEAGDPVILTDRLQNQYRSYLTSLTYKVGSYEAFSCGAESPSRNQATSFSATTKAVVKMRNALKREKTARVQAVENLAAELAESSGLYMTTEIKTDGSTVYYMHDKPTLAESRIVWKLTANAFGISTDGGRTYPYGLDVNGDAILNRIYAIGLDADYIRTGALVVRSEGKTVFSADVDTGIVSIAGDCVTIGSEKLTESINGIRALYGTCTTAQATTAKYVTCSGFSLRAGAVINVKFTYRNTASDPTLNVNGTGAKPIYLNGAALTSDYYWDVQDVITFVYSGSYWYVVDAGALSKIKATSDSITLNVSKTYATKSELTVGLNSISLSVSNARLGNTASIVLSANGKSTTRTIDLTGVRNAFKNDNTAITITAGTVTFNSNTFVVNSSYFKVTSTGVITATSGKVGGFTISSSQIYNDKMTLNSSGLHLKYGSNNTQLGLIGTNTLATDYSKYGLNFDLEPAGAYMTWATRTSSSAANYAMKLTYANKSLPMSGGGSWTAGRLHVACNTDFHNYRAYNLWIDPNTGGASGGVSMRMPFIQITSMSSSGSAAYWYTNCYLTFKNGLLTDAVAHTG